MSVASPQVTAEFGMSNAAYSRVVVAFVLSYTVMFSVGGRLVDRFSFTPVFLVPAVLYPIAWLIIAGSRTAKARIPEGVLS
jgi:MFS family permease